MAQLTRDVVTRFLADTSQMKKATQEISGSTSKIGKSFESMGNVARTAMGFLAGSTVINAIGSAIGAATDLGESVNAVNVIFGDSADKIHEWAEGAATSAGLSNAAANQLIVPIGSMLQNVGISADEAAEKSINLAQRAADMASVFNVDVSEALGAIQAGLRGEADPLERFGVGLSAAAVEAKILEAGIRDSKNEITNADKVLGRYMLLMEQTEKVAGDFANTSDSLANQQRILASNLENTKAKLGELLTGPVSGATSDLNRITGLISLLDQRIRELGEDSEETEEESKGLFQYLEQAVGIPEELSKWIREQADAQIEAAESAKEEEKALRFMADATKDDAIPAAEGLASASEDLAEEQAEVRDRVKEATAAIEAQYEAARSLVDPLFNVGEEARALAKAQEKVNTLVDEGKENTPEYAEAIEEVFTRQSRYNEASRVYAETYGPAAREEFYETMLQAGYTADEIKRAWDMLVGYANAPIRTAAGTNVVTMPDGKVVGLPRLHTGGVVPGPPGADVPIIAQAGETIIPAGHTAGGGAQVINVYIGEEKVDSIVLKSNERLRRRGL